MMGEVSRVLTVGLCGGSGTGKNTAQAYFSLCGIPGLDTDLVYHTLIGADTPLTHELAEAFGARILTKDGSVDRKALSSIVLGEGEERARLRRELNRITHRAVLAECRDWLAKQRENGAFAAIINAPLLFESGFHTECDLTVSVLAPREERIGRIMARDGISRLCAERRIDAQLDDQFLLTHTDYHIENNGTEADLQEKVGLLAAVIKNFSEGTKDGKH